MVMTHIVDLAWNQGATFRRSFVWATAGEDGSPDTPYDLTGCTARMQVREKYAAQVLLELTDVNGGLILGGQSGEITVYVTDEQTDTVGAASPTKPRTSALYDLEVVFPSGEVSRVIQGDVTISPNITRDDGDA